MFVGGFRTDLHSIQADTSAQINIEALDGKIRGEATAKRGAVISLTDRDIVGK